MLRRPAALALACVLAASAALPAAPPAHPALERGLALLREGDFEAAVIELDAATRRLEGDPAASALVPWAYVHLGVAYLELDQEAVARGKFREALARAPALRLDPGQFSAQQVRVFESVRAESPAPRVEPARPQPRATPSSEPEKKGSNRGLLLVLGGGAAAAGAAVALGGGGGGGAATTTTAPVGGGPSTTTPSPSPSPSEPPAGPTPAPTPTPSEPPPTTMPPTPPPQACRYGIDALARVPLAGCINCSASVTAEPASCRWTAQATDPSMVQITVGQGTGSGQVVFNVPPNLSPRSSRIVLVQSGDACTVSQAVLLDGPRPPGW